LKPVLKPTSNAKASAPETPAKLARDAPLNMHWRGYPKR
jgi:hypothetical protein